MVVSASIAQETPKLVEQVIRQNEATVLDPLKGSGFHEKATLSEPEFDPQKGTVDVTTTGKHLVFFPTKGFYDETPVSVLVTEEGEKPVHSSFTVSIGKNVFSTEQLTTIGKELLLLLVVSIFLEAALSVLFGWRWFQVNYEGHGWKTPIAVLGSVVFVYIFDIDTMNNVLDAFTYENQPKWSLPTKIVTTLILAGGSKLIFHLFETFGLRIPIARSREIEEQRQKARIKVRIQRGPVPEDRDVLVLVDNEVIGSISGGSNVSHLPFQSGFFIEPGAKVIGVEAFAIEKVQKKDSEEQPVTENDKPVYETRNKKVTQKEEWAIAPEADITLDFSFDS